MKRVLCPIQLETDIESFLSDSFVLRRITEIDYRFFGISHVTFSNNQAGFNILDYFTFSSINPSYVTHATHIFEFDSFEIAEKFDYALRLFKLGNLGFHYFVERYETGTGIRPAKNIPAQDYFFKNRSLNSNELIALEMFRKKIESSLSILKNQLILERWSYAACGEHMPYENRFIDLFVLLEMIHVKKNEKLIEGVRESFNKIEEINFGFNSDETINELSRLYKNRNHIMHGRVWDEITREDINFLSRFTHHSLLAVVFKK